MNKSYLLDKEAVNTSISLISGAFQPQDARELLLTLMNDKINFHVNKNFSSEERFGVADELSKKRIPELKKDIEIIKSIIQEAEEKSKTLVINSMISIKFE